jgi:hypothetical protein
MYIEVVADRRRPTDNRDLIEAFKNTLKRSTAAKNANTEDGVSSDNKPLLADVQGTARRYMLRYFALGDHVNNLIDARFGVDFNINHGRQYKLVKEAVLSVSYTWKSRSLNVTGLTLTPLYHLSSRSITLP